MAIQSVNKDKCIGCGQCVKSCPADVFVMEKETRKAVVRYPEACQLCLWCISLCNQGAILLTETKADPIFTCWG